MTLGRDTCGAGNPWQRDAAYHQGTVWAWLLGPFAGAHYRVHGEARLAQSFLTPMEQHLQSACMGSISEISVAEILRSWAYLERRIART